MTKINLIGQVGYQPSVGLKKDAPPGLSSIQFGAGEDRLDLKQKKEFKLSKSLVQQWTQFFNPAASSVGVGVVYRNLRPSVMYPALGSLKEIQKNTSVLLLGTLFSRLSLLYRDSSDRMESRVVISDGQSFTPYVKTQLLFRLGVYDAYAKGFKTGTFQTELSLADVPTLPKKIEKKTDVLLKALHDEFLNHVKNFSDPRCLEIQVKEGRMCFENILPYDADASSIPLDRNDLPKAEDLALSPPEKISISQAYGTQDVSVHGWIQQTLLLPNVATGQNNLLARVNVGISFVYQAEDDIERLQSPQVNEIVRQLYREQSQGEIQTLLNVLAVRDIGQEELIAKHGRKKITKKQLGWKSDGKGQLWGQTLPWPESKRVPVFFEALGKTVNVEIRIGSIEFKDAQGKMYQIANYGNTL
jgi:hypothetical protein